MLNDLKWNNLNFLRGNCIYRLSLLIALVAATAGLPITAAAQSTLTPPQLLPYTVKLVAGGGKATIASGATCPSSGLKSTDAFGDGCLATEVLLGNNTGGSTPGARSATVDANGNIFFTDYQAALVRRVDAVTGVVTAVAGGGATTAGTAPAGTLANAIKLSHPVGIAFAPNGDLYFSDTGLAQVFKVAATSGFITTTGAIALVAGNTSGTYGYAASNSTTTITSANSYLRQPFGIAFDKLGDLFILDEYTEAVLVLNTNASGTTTVNGVSVPAGTIQKIAGSLTSGSSTCTNGTSGSYGCSFGQYKENIQANSNVFDSSYTLAVDPAGTVYVGEEFYDSVFKITPAGVLSTFAGIQNSVGVKPTTGKRGPAGSFGIGSMFGVAADSASNVYITDASSGAIWRVDGAGNSMYAVAISASSICSTATDAYGDGCPATQAKFGSSGTGNFATTTLPGPGIYGIAVDANSNLYFGDTELNLVREISSGTNFGPIGANQPTQTVEVHFPSGDGPSSYTVTAGNSIFTLGKATCTTNSDHTTDCLLPVTATPATLGAFTGALTVTSSLGATATFPLSGTYVATPATRIAVSASPTICTGTTTFSNATPVLISANIISSGSPTGTVTFSANGTAIGTGTVSGSTATLSYTFTTAGTYNITAAYGGDSYFTPSTTPVPATVNSATPTFTGSVNPGQQNTVVRGQTALYSFNIANTYNGSITFACSGLPANSSCSFGSPSITTNGCQSNATVALSILTLGGQNIGLSSLSGTGKSPWSAVSLFAGIALAAAIGIRRRRAPLRYSQLWLALALLIASSGMLACNSTTKAVPQTPPGTYSIMVTATGSAGVTSSFSVPLTVK